MSLSQLQLLVRAFNERRGWREKHVPHQLAMSIAIEAAEVLECFQWRSPGKQALLDDQETLAALASELADVVIYVLSLSDLAEIDLEQAVRDKLQANAERFPGVKPP
jgi:dCTP diphosphatase